MIYLLKFRITNPMIPTYPLRKIELITMLTPSQVSFNHFPRSTNLLLSFQRRIRSSQNFSRLTTRLGALGWCLAASPPRVTKASRVLDTTQSAQGLGLVLTTQMSQSNSRILHLRLGSHKERLGRAQEAVERLCKWLGTNNPWEKGWRPFYRFLEKLVVRLSDQTDPPYWLDRLGDP
jgi:hypothetical protein